MTRKYPWKTSDQIIEDVKRKIMVPLAQSTFLPEDILTYADEEMAVAQVPSVMMYNEEYFVYVEYVPLVPNQTKYPIPSRAIGMKLRTLDYADEQGNLAEMTRISPDDKSAYQQGAGSFSKSARSFYLQNNNVMLAPGGQSSMTGYLVMGYYLKPNQLVQEARAAFISSFSMDTTIVNASISDGDTFSVANASFTARTSGAGTNEFNIGASSDDTATNLTNSINTAAIGITATATTNSVNTSATVLSKLLKQRQNNIPDLVTKNVTTSNNIGFVVSNNLKVKCSTTIDTSVFESTIPVDFLELAGGHKTQQIDVNIGLISGDTFTFNHEDIPLSLVVGDYICVQYECYIPQIPSDLHVTLVERTGERMLASIGDTEGAAAIDMKIQKNEQKQGILIDNRTEGNAKKVSVRHTLLRYQKTGRR